jgi:uncharacterized protein (DUF1015 family)
MADVRPFKGLRYNTEIVGELTNIVSPPFDTIPPDLQRSLHGRSPYNVVRLEAGERLPSDTDQDSRYTRSAALFADWMDKAVMVREDTPTFYLVQHTFRSQDREMSRLELMACVKLEEYERRVVLPHEYTRDEDKRDRLALMEACNANFSPIMCLYRDREHRLSSIFQLTMAGPSIMDFSDAGDQGYQVWRIDGQEQINGIREALASRPLYIADGHHRYETALTYRDLTRSGKVGVQDGDEAFNFMMIGLVEFDDPGLMVLPYHRVLGSLPDVDLARVRDVLSTFFDSEALSGGVRAGLGEFLDEIEFRGRDRLVMGLLDPSISGGYQILTLKRGIVRDEWGPIGDSEAWILEEQVLKPILGNSLGKCIDYIHDGDEAEKRVNGGEFQMGFFLKPFPLGLFEAVMDMGQRLPPKATFFYPKLPTGLVINLLEG